MPAAVVTGVSRLRGIAAAVVRALARDAWTVAGTGYRPYDETEPWGAEADAPERLLAEGVLAGMSAATGDAVVYMDADLQDPPEVIPSLVERWRQGAEVVHTVRTRRKGESPLKMKATRLAYRIIQLGSAIELPIDAGDFKLLEFFLLKKLRSTLAA